MKNLVKMGFGARQSCAGSSFIDSNDVLAGCPSDGAKWRSGGVLGLLAASAVALTACQHAPAPPAGAAAGTSAATATATATARPAIDWTALQASVGSYPTQSRFLQQPGLNQRLRAVLGPRYDVALRNLEVAGPLQLERGVYYVTGNRAHMGGIEAVAIALQPASDTVRVWLLNEGREQVLEEGRNAFAWPADVQTLIGNHHRSSVGR